MKASPRKPRKAGTRVLDARRDTLDFRDQMFVPTLVEVPVRMDLDDYRAFKIPVLDQGREGACTGYGLATVANYLLTRRKVSPDPRPVSARMCYVMARRYDEWPGEQYEGSSARGAMKAWHKHGLCSEKEWRSHGTGNQWLTARRAADAARRPLGAYFRVNHKDLVAMHSALAEVGILYATATVHTGWERVGSDGLIPLDSTATGGHAFALIAYDERGFWIQNSWGPDWGCNGFGLITYDDWLSNATDVWVARLGAPVVLKTSQSVATSFAPSARGSRSYVFADLRPHIVSIGNNGLLRTDGAFGTSEEDVREIFEEDIPRLTRKWKGAKRIMLYAHGGLVSEDAAVQRLADSRAALLDNRIYPISFIWKTDYFTTLKNILADALRNRRPEGVLDASKDFMLDRLDDAIEPLARVLSGKAEWDEMKENAELASTSSSGGVRIAFKHLARLAKEFEIHIIGHSAGSILHGHALDLWTRKTAGGFGRTVKSCTLWAPACTMDLLKNAYVPALTSGALEKLTLFTLTDQVEQDDDCAGIYHKSLLYLVSNAFEKHPRIPLFQDGVPIAGMEKFLGTDPAIDRLIKQGKVVWIKTPNDRPIGAADASRARHHVDYDEDEATMKAALTIMLAGDRPPVQASKVVFRGTAADQRALRRTLDRNVVRAMS